MVDGQLKVLPVFRFFLVFGFAHAIFRGFPAAGTDALFDGSAADLTGLASTFLAHRFCTF
jgi:hypothetical protein